MVLWCLLLILTDISSMYQEARVGFLLTEEENEEKRKKNKSSQSSNRNGKTIEFVRDTSKKLCK